jgi:hypothetical protein
MTTSDAVAGESNPDRPPGRHQIRPRRDYRIHAGAVTGVIAVLAIGGYSANWRWTGFEGNTLWDWLHLLILPVVLAVLPHWLGRSDPLDRRSRWLLILLGAAFVVLVIGGYTFDWKWTGFRGNTLWDWMELLFVPFVLPIVLAQLIRGAEAAAGDAETGGLG